MAQIDFREKSIQKFSSPERTDAYVKRAGIGRGIVLGAAALLAAAGVMWGAAQSVEGQLLEKDAVGYGQTANE